MGCKVKCKNCNITIEGQVCRMNGGHFKYTLTTIIIGIYNLNTNINLYMVATCY